MPGTQGTSINATHLPFSSVLVLYDYMSLRAWCPRKGFNACLLRNCFPLDSHLLPSKHDFPPQVCLTQALALLLTGHAPSLWAHHCQRICPDLSYNSVLKKWKIKGRGGRDVHVFPKDKTLSSLMFSERCTGFRARWYALDTLLPLSVWP